MHTPITEQLLYIVLLRHHVGKDNGVSGEALVVELLGGALFAPPAQMPMLKRHLRKAVEGLRTKGVPVCWTSEAGYHMAQNDGELWDTIDFLWSRTSTTLKQIRALRRDALPTLLQKEALI